jgi:hypothetical protein
MKAWFAALACLALVTGTAWASGSRGPGDADNEPCAAPVCVPEPATFGLMGAGAVMLALGWFRRSGRRPTRTPDDRPIA